MVALGRPVQLSALLRLGFTTAHHRPAGHHRFAGLNRQSWLLGNYLVDRQRRALRARGWAPLGGPMSRWLYDHPLTWAELPGPRRVAELPGLLRARLRALPLWRRPLQPLSRPWARWA